MDASLASLIAVTGTVLGSALTYLFQARQSRRAERRELLHLLRQERLSAYTGFIAAATDFRRSAYDHWYRKQEGLDTQDFLLARSEADRMQAVVDRAIALIQLLSDDAALIAAAQQVHHATEAIRRATSKEERDTQEDHCQTALDGFIARASRQLVPRLVFGPLIDGMVAGPATEVGAATHQPPTSS